MHGLCLLLLCVFSISISGQDMEPVVRPPRVEKAPHIDGVLDDAAWLNAAAISDFRQMEPVEGAPATERTEVRLCHDGNYLYIGLRAFDSEPDRIVANIFERDSDMFLDDAFMVAIDSLRDHRTAFMFETNARGTQADVQLAEGGGFNISWDAIWYSKGSIDAQGYCVEMAIPFFVLRFKPAEEVEMGILLRRLIRRKNEFVYWPELKRDFSLYNMNKYGAMAGLRGIERGVNVEIKPYLTAGFEEDRGDSDPTADAGLDVKWGLTPNLTADFTANTDFAQVESDALMVNLSRFSLFYPEKRDFFLESEDLFHFGLGGTAHVFFSRRIGLQDGREVPILTGGRLYGLVGDTNIGLLSIQTQESGGIDAENFSVLRLKQNVFGRSYVGGIFTNRSGRPSEEDQTFGFDGVLLHGPDAGVFAALARSNRGGVENGNWFRTLAYFNRTDKYEAMVHYTDIGPRFDPGIGFIMRRDQRTFFLHGGYKPRPGWTGVRQLKFLGDYSRTYNYAGEVESAMAMAQVDMLLHSDDRFTVILESHEELVPYDFEVAPGVVIPAGRYSFTQAWPGFSLSASRKISAFGGFAKGGYYGGDLTVAGADVFFKPIPRFQFGCGSEFYDVSVPAGSFTSTIYRVNISYYFSPVLTTRAIAQYLTLYEDFVVNLRLRWIFSPGSELWTVYDERRRFDLPGSSLTDRVLIVKLVYNFNF